MVKEHKISEKKIKTVKEIASLIDNYDTIMIATTSGLGSSHLQNARKILRGKAEVRYVKKSAALRALDSSKKEGVKKLKEQVNESPALIFTNEDPFDLAVTLSENKFPAKAKEGQISDRDVIIEAGGTDLMPGPVLSEFGAVGIKAGIVSGKIAIKEDKVLIKEGDKITRAIASILTKLDMTPFEVGLNAQTAYDSKADKVYIYRNKNRQGRYTCTINRGICKPETICNTNWIPHSRSHSTNFSKCGKRSKCIR